MLHLTSRWKLSHLITHYFSHFCLVHTQILRLLFVEANPAPHSRSIFLLKLLSVELETKSYYLVNHNVRGYLSWELWRLFFFQPIAQLLWLCSLNNSLICHWSHYFCIRHSYPLPSLSHSPCRLPSVPQPDSALGAPRGGPSALLPSHLSREWQRPCYHLQGVSEPDLCGGKDPPACGEVRGLQWSYGRFLDESVLPHVAHILDQHPLLKG